MVLRFYALQFLYIRSSIHFHPRKLKQRGMMKIIQGHNSLSLSNSMYFCDQNIYKLLNILLLVSNAFLFFYLRWIFIANRWSFFFVIRFRWYFLVINAFLIHISHDKWKVKRNIINFHYWFMIVKYFTIF